MRGRRGAGGTEREGELLDWMERACKLMFPFCSLGKPCLTLSGLVLRGQGNIYWTWSSRGRGIPSICLHVETGE